MFWDNLYSAHFYSMLHIIAITCTNITKCKNAVRGGDAEHIYIYTHIFHCIYIDVFIYIYTHVYLLFFPPAGKV